MTRVSNVYYSETLRELSESYGKLALDGVQYQLFGLLAQTSYIP